MNGITDFVNQFIRVVIRVVLIAAVAFFLVSLLFATLVVMLAATVWALVTGRKPQASRIFGQFRQTSARYTRGAWPRVPVAGRQDIVDVQPTKFGRHLRLQEQLTRRRRHRKIRRRGCNTDTQRAPPRLP